MCICHLRSNAVSGWSRIQVIALMFVLRLIGTTPNELTSKGHIFVPWFKLWHLEKHVQNNNPTIVRYYWYRSRIWQQNLELRLQRLVILQKSWIRAVVLLIFKILDKMPTTKKLTVAVIGAGLSGITAVKCALDEGLEPTCFEQDDKIGKCFDKLN